MRATTIARTGLLGLLALAAASCGGINLGQPRTAGVDETVLRQRESTPLRRERRETIFDLFRNVDDPNTTLEVNRYIWTATQDVLNFMPVEAVDPFSGVIVYGFGVPPGGATAYRATVYVRDPALEARSLSVALQTRSGPAPAATVREVENAILTRARQLRLRDARL